MDLDHDSEEEGGITGHDKSEKESINEEKSQEDKEEIEEGKYIEPVLDGRNITFVTRIINEHLLCPLCFGYFRTAYTIKECLHTFCKSCIFKYFLEKCECPKCAIPLAPNPYDKIGYDCLLQGLVEKIVPDIVAKDKTKEIEFNEKNGIDINNFKREGSYGFVKEEPKLKKLRSSRGVDTGGVPPPSAHIEKPKPKSVEESTIPKVYYPDQVSFQLIVDPLELEKGSQLKPLDKPVVSTSAKATICHLKKYLKIKLNLATIDDIEILYNGQVLGAEHTLEYVMKTRGIKATDSPIYRYRKKNDLLYSM